MRILACNLLAAICLLLGATGASAFAINMSVRGGAATAVLTVSDTVTVDVVFDATAVNLNICLLGLVVRSRKASPRCRDGEVL